MPSITYISVRWDTLSYSTNITLLDSVVIRREITHCYRPLCIDTVLVSLLPVCLSMCYFGIDEGFEPTSASELRDAISANVLPKVVFIPTYTNRFFLVPSFLPQRTGCVLCLLISSKRRVLFVADLYLVLQPTLTNDLVTSAPMYCYTRHSKASIPIPHDGVGHNALLLFIVICKSLFPNLLACNWIFYVSINFFHCFIY